MKWEGDGKEDLKVMKICGMKKQDKSGQVIQQAM
jgi:hypothetical protein